MKVYAEFFVENGIEYRTKTILQFGDNWELIGSIVMKNPGSAATKNKNQIEDDTLKKIRVNYYKSGIDKKNWFVFQPDPTMYQVEKIFNGSYIGNRRELNGVILIFNLFNIRENDIVKAKNIYKIAMESNSQYLHPIENEVIELFKDKPVYLSWYWEWQFVNQSLASKIFDYVSRSNFMYLKDDKINNSFYHPNYINRPNIYKSPKVQNILQSFLKFYN